MVQNKITIQQNTILLLINIKPECDELHGQYTEKL